MALPFKFVFASKKEEIARASPYWTMACHNLTCVYCSQRYSRNQASLPDHVIARFAENKRVATARPRPVKYGYCSTACANEARDHLAESQAFIEANAENLETLKFFRKAGAVVLEKKMEHHRKVVEYYARYED